MPARFSRPAMRDEDGLRERLSGHFLEEDGPVQAPYAR